MSLQLDTLSWPGANQPLLLFINDGCLATKQQIPISVWFDQELNPCHTALKSSTLSIIRINSLLFYCIVSYDVTGPSWTWSYGSWIYNYLCNQCLSQLKLWVRMPLTRSVLHTTLCDKVCQWLAAGRCFSQGTPVSPTNKTDRHDITEILLKVAFNTITLPYPTLWCYSVCFRLYL